MSAGTGKSDSQPFINILKYKKKEYCAVTSSTFATEYPANTAQPYNLAWLNPYLVFCSLGRQGSKQTLEVPLLQFSGYLLANPVL